MGLTARIQLELPMPPSVNKYWVAAAGGRGLVPSTEAIEYKEEVRAQVSRQVATPLVGSVSLVALIGCTRASDLGNRLKVLEDALNEVAYLDDNQIDAILLRRADELRGTPRPVRLSLIGQAFASPRQVAEFRERKRLARERRRQSTNRNRREKQLDGRRLTPAEFRPPPGKR